MKAHRQLLLLTAMLGSSVSLACKAPAPETFQVRVMSIDAHGGPALQEDRVHSIVRRSLALAPSFSPAERDRRSGGRSDALVASFEYRELPDPSDHGRDLMVRLKLEAPVELADRLGPEGLDVTILLEREAGEADLSADLQLATDRVTTILQARADLARGAGGAVIDLLESGDSDLVLLTLEWIREHGDETQAKLAANHVAELIKDEDERVGLLAIETIGEIGGPEHVSALLERIQLADSHQVSRAYDALSRLGGPEAAGFLEFAARNEDEPERRAAAERALRRVADSAMVGAGGRDDRTQNRGHR